MPLFAVIRFTNACDKASHIQLTVNFFEEQIAMVYASCFSLGTKLIYHRHSCYKLFFLVFFFFSMQDVMKFFHVEQADESLSWRPRCLGTAQ